MSRAGEKDIKKIMELIRKQIKKLTAKDVGALPDTTPTYKETKIKLNDVNDGMVVLGKNGSNTTDITDIIRKANTLQEGMILARISNRMGYIIFQNFRIDCTKLTDEERALVQSFTSIVVRKSNNSADYPTLIPANMNETMDCQITSKTGYSFESVKVTMRSNSTNSEIEYNMPSKFRNDDNSQNNLAFYTDKWATMFGVDIKDRK